MTLYVCVVYYIVIKNNIIELFSHFNALKAKINEFKEERC
jgi:hypothetical protein